MQKNEQAFANLVRSCRKKHIGKGPEKVEVTFKGSWAIAYMTGALSKVDNFYLKDARNEEMLRYLTFERLTTLNAV